MTYNEQETTWNEPQRSEATYNKQKTTYSNLQQIDSNFMEPLCLKNSRLEGLSVLKRPKMNALFVIFCIIWAYAKGWQAEKSKQTSEQNETGWKNIK